MLNRCRFANLSTESKQIQGRAGQPDLGFFDLNGGQQVHGEQTFGSVGLIFSEGDRIHDRLNKKSVPLKGTLDSFGFIPERANWHKLDSVRTGNRQTA